MPRSFGKVFASRNSDSDWRALSRDAQWLYDALISQTRLTLAGSLDLMPTRWAQLAAGTSVADVEAALDELASARFVAVDRDTEEVVVRTLVRHDLDAGRLNRNLVKGLWSAWTGIMSTTLRKVVVDNLPDIIWEKSGTSAPDEALQMRRSPRLELPVETTGSDRPFEPSVETDRSDDQFEPPVALSPVAGHLSPAAATREPRGVSDLPDERRAAAPVDNSRLSDDPCLPEPGTVPAEFDATSDGSNSNGSVTGADEPGTPSPASTDEERQRRLRQACQLLTDRTMAVTASRRNRGAHARSMLDGKLADHHQQGHRLLHLNPRLTAAALADLLESPPANGNGHRPPEPARVTADGVPFIPGIGEAPGLPGGDRPWATPPADVLAATRQRLAQPDTDRQADTDEGASQ